ncbi:Uncharacterised protein [uncultured archaeon]|nr:Uncharacterised protein [uncultured archaeon]
MNSAESAIAAVSILFMMLLLAAPALAGHEAGTVGPYIVSFDMNTTQEYKVIVEAATSGRTSLGVDYTRYNLTVDGTNYFVYLVLTKYSEPMVANETANAYVVLNALQNAGADKPKLYKVAIDGQPGIVGNFRFENLYLGKGASQQGDLVVAACYSPDGKVSDDGVYRGETDCRVMSTYPWEIIRDFLNSLHVESPSVAGTQNSSSSE